MVIVGLSLVVMMVFVVKVMMVEGMTGVTVLRWHVITIEFIEMHT